MSKHAALNFIVYRPPPSAVELISTALKLSRAELKRLLGDGRHTRLIIEAAAQIGIAAAQVLLGRMLLEGAGGLKDEAAAYCWFQRAAARGDTDASNMVGRCLENGWGVAVDLKQAARCYRRAAQAGDSWAQYNLGHLYLNGQGVRRDPIEALHWYQQSARQGHARAMNLVARCYEQAWGVARDPEQAASWYRSSAEAGYFRGQYNYASVLMSRGRQSDALAWLGRALDQAPPRTRELMRASAAGWGAGLASCVASAS